MLYNIYYKDKYPKEGSVLVKVNDSSTDKHEWLDVKHLNDKDFKDCTKEQFNIFEAKKFMNEAKDRLKQMYLEDDCEYWIEQIKD